MLACIRDEPRALKFLHSLTEGEQNYYVKWVYSAKKEDTKVERLAKTVDRLASGLKFYD